MRVAGGRGGGASRGAALGGFPFLPGRSPRTMKKYAHPPGANAPPGRSAAPGPAISSDRAAAPSAHAVQVTGGGTTTFGADLDGDGDVDGSHFGFAAVIAGDGSAQGHFTCLMAGNANFLGLHVMAVQGPVTSGALDGDS